jgi:hypothetical protein
VTVARAQPTASPPLRAGDEEVHATAVVVRRGKIGLAVGVDVGGGDHAGVSDDSEGCGYPDFSRAVAEEHSGPVVRKNSIRTS